MKKKTHKDCKEFEKKNNMNNRAVILKREKINHCREDLVKEELERSVLNE